MADLTNMSDQVAWIYHFLLKGGSPVSGGQPSRHAVAVTIELGPNTLLALANIFGADPGAIAKMELLSAQLKTESDALKTAVDAQRPPVADKRP